VPVPETPLNENRGHPTRHHDVRSTWKFRGVESVSQAQTRQHTPNGKFRLGVFAANTSHDVAPLRLRVDVGHRILQSAGLALQLVESPRVGEDVKGVYDLLKKAAKADMKSVLVRSLMSEIARISLKTLSSEERINLLSQVPEKSYFAFRRQDTLSRPANAALFENDPAKQEALLKIFDEWRFSEVDAMEATRSLYLVAMSFFAANDLRSPGDQKTPGTFFEVLAGHLMATLLGVNPKKSIKVLSLDMKGSLPTDFIFDLGVKDRKFHVPVKTSTRERVIQVWAHQKVLDGIYGAGRYAGVLVAAAETKLDRKKLEVVEICLPDQWRVYQMFIAKLERVYYLDVPTKYAALSQGYPKIDVRPLGKIFSELDQL
jgi:hypothetical protein